MKWKAYLRLRGETWIKKREGMPDEFVRLVEFLRGVDVDYNLVVFVQADGSRVLHSQHSGHGSEAWARRERSGI